MDHVQIQALYMSGSSDVLQEEDLLEFSPNYTVSRWVVQTKVDEEWDQIWIKILSYTLQGEIKKLQGACPGLLLVDWLSGRKSDLYYVKSNIRV